MINVSADGRPQPRAILIGGANGAGKTTFTRQLFSFLGWKIPFLNADEIQKSDPEFFHPVSAGKEMLLRLDELVRTRRPFAAETTLASLYYASAAAAWRAAGYRVTLHFIEVPNADFAVRSVAPSRRVGRARHPRGRRPAPIRSRPR